MRGLLPGGRQRTPREKTVRAPGGLLPGGRRDGRLELRALFDDEEVLLLCERACDETADLIG
jgi:hypothetical protein